MQHFDDFKLIIFNSFRLLIHITFFFLISCFPLNAVY